MPRTVGVPGRGRSGVVVGETGARTVGYGGVVYRETFAASSDVSVALTGASASYALGSVGNQKSVTLSGISAGYSLGSLSTAPSVGISGASASYSLGTATPGIQISSSGQVSTYAQGNLSPATAVNLTGEAALYSLGVVSVPGDVTVALSGISATFELGSVAVLALPTEAPVTGGWVDPKAYRALLRRAKAHQKKLEDAQDEKQEERQKREDALLASLSETYERLAGAPLPEQAEDVAESLAQAPEDAGRAAIKPVYDAIAVYASVARMRDLQAMQAAFDRLDVAIMQARVAHAEADDMQVIEAVDEHERQLVRDLVSVLGKLVNTKGRNAFIHI